jgi:hypothetical protein
MRLKSLGLRAVHIWIPALPVEVPDCIISVSVGYVVARVRCMFTHEQGLVE